jgi:hypothetical protein
LHCGRHPRLAPLLPDIQQALSALLGDQNELTQARAAPALPPQLAAGGVCAAAQRCRTRARLPLLTLLGTSHCFMLLLACFCLPTHTCTSPHTCRFRLHPPAITSPPFRRWRAGAWLLCTTWLTRRPARRCSTR